MTTLTAEKTDLPLPSGSPARNLETHHGVETVSPDHPDVRTWEETLKHLQGLSPTEKLKYEAESKELWGKFDAGNPRMIRTARGAMVHYDPQG